MQFIKNIFFTLSGLVLTVILLGAIYLFLDNEIGTIVLLIGFICLFALFVLTLIGLVRGSIKWLKLNNRFSISLILIYVVVTSILLCGIWGFNFVLHHEFGIMSAKEKIQIFQGEIVSSDEMRLEIIQEYPVLEHQHITFRYHPDTEKQVQEIINRMEDITQLEKEIFGEEITKTETLEVIVLRSSKEFNQLNPIFTETIGGSYESTNKRVIIYQSRENFADSESFMIGTFAHEYGHFLLDLFSKEKGIHSDEFPAWYNEGLCEYIRHQIVDNIQIREEINTNIKYTDLHTSENWNSESENTDVYYLAQRAIEYIVGRQGNAEVLSNILLHQKETGTFEESFFQLTGVKLDTLNKTIFSMKEDLEEAWKAWSQESDFEKAGKLYEEITEKYSHESLVWHQFALMLEEQKKWDEALIARRKVISLSPEDSAGFQNISYLLTIIDPSESLEMANKALELTKKDPDGNVEFIQKWLNEISQFNDLISEEKYAEAYQAILRSEQLSYQTTVLEELKKQEKENSSGL
ncbi:collagenase [Metabacillus sp. B2-18]|uniref:collagenase n=1 Tax=Metabacillus sp. B2-18 TaxID=2897333 RepID=UPI001E4D6D8F|nr:collagenase [Metabacillus sp. B2-18]UGB32801.1 hypothetical protein LPC09_10410 [Metabacillus sp. B2-18]